MSHVELTLSEKERARYDKVSGALKKKNLRAGTRKRLGAEYRALKGKTEDPGFLTRPRTPSDLHRELATAGDAKYGPALRQAEGQIKAIPTWYDAYKDEVGRAEQTTGQAYQQARQSLQDTQTRTNTAEDARRKALDDAAREDAARRGATYDPQTAAVSAQAQTGRDRLSEIFIGQMDTQNANTRANLTNRKTTIEGEKGQALKRAEGAKSDLLKEKGTFASDYLKSIREDERKYGLERAAFGVDTQKAQTDAQDKAERRRLTKRGQDITVRGQDLADARARAKARSKGKGKGGKPRGGPGSLTPAQEGKIIGQVDQTKAWIKKLRKDGNSESQIRDTLRRGKTVPGQVNLDTGTKTGTVKIPAFDDDYINAAFDLVAFGTLSRPNIAALHRRGIHIPPKWRKRSVNPKVNPDVSGPVSG